MESTSYTYEETNDRLTTDTFVNYAMQEAEKQSMQKFGSKIGPVIEDEFKDVVLPKIEEAIAELANDVPEESLQSLAISQKPAGGNNEKIFHVYDTKSGNDLLRFHVREIIHRKMDIILISTIIVLMMDIQDTMSLGNIYWNTNVPPKWLS